MLIACWNNNTVLYFLYNNIEGKITECWLVNEEGIFFPNFACGLKAKLLANNWSSGCLATAYAIKKCCSQIFCVMKSSFKIVVEEYI